MERLYPLLSILFVSISLQAQNLRIDDGHLLGTMEEIEASLISNEHSQKQLKHANNLLQQALNALEPEIGKAILTISHESIFDFGSRATGSTSSIMMTLTNSGDTAATSMSADEMVAPFGFTGGAYPGTGGDCGSSLKSGQTCNIELAFSPWTIAVFNDRITINYSSGVDNKTATRNVTGTGVAPALLSISGKNPYNFGLHLKNDNPESHTLVISNTGGTTATGISEVGMNSPFIFTGGAYPGTVGDCSTSLAPGASCKIDISYNPAVSNGVNKDSLELIYSDGAFSQMASRDLIGSTYESKLAIQSEQ